MYKIIKLNDISDLAGEALGANYSITADATDPNAILLRSFDMHTYETAASVVAVARAGAGVNNIPIDKMSAKGICVFNTPGANANAVKELVICALMLGGRKLVEGINWTQNIDPASDVAKLVEKGKKAFIGQEIFGKTLGVVGLGAIGRMVAGAAIALGMKVVGYDPFLNINGALLLDPQIKLTTNIDDIYSQSNFITLHVPATEQTKNSINTNSIAKMKDGVVIINCARGELVSDDEIIVAVNSGKVGRYITDLPNAKLLGNANIITLPHLGASTPEAEDNCAVMAANELKDYMENGNITNSVNFPAISCKKCDSSRFAVVYTNENDMLAQLTSTFDAQKIKVTALNFATRATIGYCLVDTDKTLTADKIKALSSIKNVLKVNVL